MGLSELETFEQRHEELANTRVLPLKQRLLYLASKNPWSPEDVWVLSDSHL